MTTGILLPTPWVDLKCSQSGNFILPKLWLHPTPPLTCKTRLQSGLDGSRCSGRGVAMPAPVPAPAMPHSLHVKGMSVDSRALPFPAQTACHRRRRETHSSTSAGLFLSAQKALNENSQLVNRAKDGLNQ